MQICRLLIPISALGFVSCATTTSPPSVVGQIVCGSASADLYAIYPTARVSTCEAGSSDNFIITIRPEHPVDPVGKPINNSAWYGFRVNPKRSGNLSVTLNYENGRHRYRPKISYNGSTWKRLEESQIEEIGKTKVEFDLELDTRPFYISGQEIFSQNMHIEWTDEMAKLPFVTSSDIGYSEDGNAIQMLAAKLDDQKRPYVILVGRQHPPEVTGALALIPFVETVLGDSELARTFRQNYNVMIVPLLNPDGVDAGHWRFNKGGTDLNRDWGPFVQPETQAMKSALSIFDSGEAEPALFLDFHSTWKNLFYTQTDDEATSPAMFAHHWLTASDARIDDDIYPFTREASGTSDQANSKNYMFKTYGITAITYEVGDRTDRDAIKVSAQVFAEEMMKLMNIESEQLKN